MDKPKRLTSTECLFCIRHIPWNSARKTQRLKSQNTFFFFNWPNAMAIICVRFLSPIYIAFHRERNEGPSVVQVADFIIRNYSYESR